MPELPEVEVLARHLAPLLRGQKIRGVQVRRAKVLHPTAVSEFESGLLGARFNDVSRRAKFLRFDLTSKAGQPFLLLGHLGMTGRMYLLPKTTPLPKHAAVILDLGKWRFVYEDTRYFGRLTLEVTSLAQLGPEPLSGDFNVADFTAALKRSVQPIKVKLLDQSLVAGIGNIYASEALFRARLSPQTRSNRLRREEVRRLRLAIRRTLADAISRGSTLPLNYGPGGSRDGLFYFGRADGAPDYYEERLLVYDRAGKPCRRCGTEIRRSIQAARRTYDCPTCQRGPKERKSV
ncbi:MAG: bifunctional DNA-formamidopyrimidine glycosylase/DNA-(apurinic or apyrimidinic site) lyase [Verrucomicrobiota bacterium]